MTDSRVAALWLGALQRLADGASHEVNNALNGVVVNLEVVRVRATPGGDAGRVAPFADAAAGEAEAASALVAALVALARTPRGGGAATDVALVARQVVALLAPAVAHRGVRVVIEAGDPVLAGGDPLAVRAAVALALLAGAAAHRPVELGGADPADEPSGRLWCIVTAGPRMTVQVAPSQGIAFPAEAAGILRGAGIDVVVEGHETLALTFRGADGGA